MGQTWTPLAVATQDYFDYREDVLRSDYEFFENSLKRFMQLLEPDELLGKLADHLLPAVDFDNWYAACLQIVGDTVGSDKLNWPVDRPERVALQRELLKRMADGRISWLEFCANFTGGRTPNLKVSKLKYQLFRPFSRDFLHLFRAERAAVTSTARSEASTANPIRMLINEARLSEIRALRVVGYDLTRLVKLCEELNACYQVDAYHAVIMLTRAILDHVPPLLECKNFEEVANNYSGAKSFRQAMGHLQGAARRIADLHLHVPVRAVESLPNATQVNFSQDLDFLLAEIVRHCKVIPPEGSTMI